MAPRYSSSHSTPQPLHLLGGDSRVADTSRVLDHAHGLGEALADAPQDALAVLGRARVGVVDLEQLLDEGGTPPGRGVLEDVLLELAVVGLAHLGGHGDGVVDGVGELLGVPGVDDEARGERLGGARELGQDHDAVAVALARDVLVRHEVHAVARRRHEADVRHGVERRQLVRVHALVQEVDRHELDRPEPPVDPPHQLVHHRPQVLVLLDVAAGGDRHLHEHDLAPPLRVLREEHLERVQLLRHALDVVQAVDAHDELDALEFAPQRGDALLDLGLLQALGELLRVDAYREGADGDELPLELDAVGGGVGLEDARAGAEEVAGVVVGVEADEVAVQEALQELLPDRQNPVDLAAGEGGVKEEANLNVLLVLQQIPQHLG